MTTIGEDLTAEDAANQALADRVYAEIGHVAQQLQPRRRRARCAPRGAGLGTRTPGVGDCRRAGHVRAVRGYGTGATCDGRCRKDGVSS